MTHREAIEKLSARTDNAFCIVVDTWRHRPGQLVSISYRVSYFDEHDKVTLFNAPTLEQAMSEALASMDFPDNNSHADEVDSSVATIEQVDQVNP